MLWWRGRTSHHLNHIAGFCTTPVPLVSVVHTPSRGRPAEGKHQMKTCVRVLKHCPFQVWISCRRKGNTMCCMQLLRHRYS